MVEREYNARRRSTAPFDSPEKALAHVGSLMVEEIGIGLVQYVKLLVEQQTSVVAPGELIHLTRSEQSGAVVYQGSSLSPHFFEVSFSR
jgi:hypothetical protein